MEIDPVNVVAAMAKLEAELGKEWKRNPGLIDSKATSTSNYDGAIAIQTITLKAAGDAISIIKDKAKGACKDELYQKILGEEMLKAHYVRIDILRSQLSAKKGVLEKFNLL